MTAIHGAAGSAAISEPAGAGTPDRAGAPTPAPTVECAADLELLDSIQRRVLWLAVRMIDAANRERETGDGVKVGGHMASSASLVSVMTALWKAHLDSQDRVAVKPHASPVLHALNYLLGAPQNRRLLLPAEHPTDRPGAVRRSAGPDG